MKNEENQNEEIEEEIKNDDKKENKEKKNKKLSKKQRKEEERKRKEEEKKKKIEEKKEKEKKEKEENDKNKNEEKNGNKEDENNDKNIKSNETSNPNINKREEFIIDTSTKNLNDEDDEKKENIRELGTTSQKNEKEDDKENVNDNINKDENNDNIHKIIKKLKKARRGSICQELNIKEDECNYVIDKAYGILEKEESLLKISAPLYICGDIHGQYYDLLRVFDILKYPPQSTFLFLGDYVDRGKQSLECLLLLLCLKIKYPDKIFLLRGNHECEALNKMYGFFDECKRRLSIKCFKKIITLFNIMPISALISKDLQNIEQINKILRPTDIPNEGLLCDILWSDPNESLNEDFGSNERNISVTFSKDVVKNFLEKNNLDLICRAHQVVEEGFEFFADMKLVTIFTAPNYMGEFDNNGGILEVGEDLLCKFHVLRPNFERNGNRKRITQLIN